MKDKARLAVSQWQMSAVHDFADFAEQCAHAVGTAAEYGADFLLFPEYFTTQLLSCIADKDALRSANELADLTPQYVELFSHLAEKHRINVVAGSTLVRECGALFNAAFFFDRQGNHRKQYKIHITPNERSTWNVHGGSDVEVFESDRGKVAILVCYDIEFPELARIAAHLGAQIIFVPFNTDQRAGYMRVRYCAQARCVENHVYVAISGCSGLLTNATNASLHYAQSAIFTPCDYAFPRDGIQAEAEPNCSTILIEDLDLSLLKTHRETGSVRNWNDRRTDCYRLTYGPALID